VERRAATSEPAPGAEAVGRDRGADARAAPVELLAHQQAVEGAEAETAVLLRDVDVHQAELVRLGDQVGRVQHVGVVGGLARPDLPLGERVRERAQLLLLLRQCERDACRRALVDRDHRVLQND